MKTKVANINKESKKNMPLSTPVVLIIFNRPDLTEIVFQAIAQAKPRKLFVVADGARFPEEVAKCQQTRAVIEKVDWECEVFTNFSEKNLGSGQRVATGMDWVFSEVEEAIILEDDVLPTPSFFNYCQTLLEYYRHDERIMHINGDNSLNQRRNEYSYYFSHYAHVWGWASWRRAWRHYDFYIKTWPEFKSQRYLELLFEDSYEQRYWESILEQMYEDPRAIDAWDYQWMYTCWTHNGLSIMPNCNMISNLGFNRPDATHTLGESPRANLPTTDIWEIKHPQFVIRHRQADRYTFDYVFEGKQMREQDRLMREQNRLPQKIRRRLSKVKKKFLSGLKLQNKAFFN
jgi:hypothetical protein